MINIFKNSFIYKLALKVYNTYKNGRINATILSVSKFYSVSKTKLLLDNFYAKESATNTSLYAKFSQKIVDILVFIGDIYHKSIICKIFNSFVSFFDKLFKNSFIPFHKLTFKGFLLVIFALYLPIDYTLRSIIKISALASIWDELLFVLFIITVIYRIMTKKSNLGLKITTFDTYIFLYITVGLFLMFYVSPNFSIAFAGYRAVFQYILWFFVIIRLLETKKDFKILYNTLMLVGIGLGLHGIYQFIIGVPIPSTWVTSSEAGVRTRVFSITGSPNILGSILVLFTPMVTAYAYTLKSMFLKICALGFTGLLCLSILFTFSKGAWLGLAVAIIIFAIFLDKRLIALMFSALTLVVIFVPSVVNRITFLFTSDYVTASEAGGRMLRWAKGLELLHSGNPLFGFGLGRFGGAVAMQNQVIERTADFEYFYLDNYYLKTLVEMGYLGLIFYIILLVAFVVLSIKAIGRMKDTYFYAPCVAMFSGMCGVLVHCYFENIFEVPYMVAYFFAMASMIMFAGFLHKKKT